MLPQDTSNKFLRNSSKYFLINTSKLRRVNLQMEVNLLEITFQKICTTNADVNPVPSEAISDSGISGTNLHPFGHVKKSSFNRMFDEPC
jgi:hypothetical protein